MAGPDLFCERRRLFLNFEESCTNLNSKTMAAARLAALLQARQQAVAVAECASGGLIASTFSRLREAPHFFRGGVVISHENAAQSILGIDSMAPTATEAHALQLARAVQV
jgi:nicotinamide mononucleotide (NMN) deamidase PncC